MSSTAAVGLEAQLETQLGDFALDVSLALPPGAVSCLFGPSGSGKTTILRCLAGLAQARGSVRCGDAVWQDDARGVAVPVHRRRIGYVFQDAALFPHLTVAGNLDYAWRRVPAAEQTVSRADVIAWLGLDDLLARGPGTLSGGQRQRVAIARALLSSPRLLLMDEPVASLDLGARQEVLEHLQRVQRRLALPVVYVTHDPSEVARLADHVVWLGAGRVRAAGPAAELLSRLELGVSLGGEAVSAVQARVRAHDPDYPQTVLDCPWGPLRVARLDLSPGEAVRVRVRAGDVSLDLDPPGRSSISNVLDVQVLGSSPLGGGEVLVRLGGPPAPGDEALLARITSRSRDLLELEPGTQVHARIKAVSLSSAGLCGARRARRGRLVEPGNRGLSAALPVDPQQRVGDRVEQPAALAGPHLAVVGLFDPALLHERAPHAHVVHARVPLDPRLVQLQEGVARQQVERLPAQPAPAPGGRQSQVEDGRQVVQVLHAEQADPRVEVVAEPEGLGLLAGERARLDPVLDLLRRGGGGAVERPAVAGQPGDQGRGVGGQLERLEA